MKTWMTLLLAAIVLAAPLAMAEEAEKAVGDPYPLGVCAVSGEELGSMGDPVVKVENGREVKFCCSGCVGKYEKMTEQFSAELDKKIVALEEPLYPLATCVKSGKELTADAKVFVVGNRLVKTCCGNCEKAVEEDPAAYIEKLNAAVVEAQSKDYPAGATCPVSGKPIEGDGQPVVLAGKLVKLCCGGCKGKALAEPAVMLSKVYGETK
ncbi:MAG: hypothetical protein GC168_01785 [Candidatus Hydrogenedens sp.]|nr:hypothetical protein [Candidatus Hydrogenedens sp.]